MCNCLQIVEFINNIIHIILIIISVVAQYYVSRATDQLISVANKWTLVHRMAQSIHQRKEKKIDKACNVGDLKKTVKFH